MQDTAPDFSSSLSASARVGLVRKISGTIRIDVADARDEVPTLVVIDKGEVTVRREHSRADCVISGNHEVLDRIISGQSNMFTALLRGELSVSGDSELLVLFQREFSRYRASHDQTRATGASSTA